MKMHANKVTFLRNPLSSLVMKSPCPNHISFVALNQPQEHIDYPPNHGLKKVHNDLNPFVGY